MSQRPWKPFDDSERRARDVFTPVVRVGATSLGPLACSSSRRSSPPTRPASLILSVCIFIAAGAAWVCMRRNRTRLGAGIIIGTFWIVQTAILLLSQRHVHRQRRMCSPPCSRASRSAPARCWWSAASASRCWSPRASELRRAYRFPRCFPRRSPRAQALSIAFLIGAVWTLHVFIRRMENAFDTAAR